MKNSCLQWQVNLMGALIFSYFFFNIFFLEVNCALCVIYVREDSYSNV